jgi:hypothetical protein
MGVVAEFHTSSDEDGDKVVHHNQSTCNYAIEIIKNGNKVLGKLANSKLCERCEAIAAGK